jgi:hypothetical protein
MSRKFSTFPNGDPPQDTDVFLLGRVDGSPSGFSNYTLTWAQLKAAAGVISVPSFLLQESGSFFLLEDGVSKLMIN